MSKRVLKVRGERLDVKFSKKKVTAAPVTVRTGRIEILDPKPPPPIDLNDHWSWKPEWWKDAARRAAHDPLRPSER